MMRYLSLAMLLILLGTPKLTRTQSAISDKKDVVPSRCPVIRWIDSEPWDWKSPIRFEVQVEGADPEAKLRYTWVVSSGRILSGQDTNSIMAGVPSGKTNSFTATLVICGLPDECQNVTSVSKVKPLQTADQPDSH